MSAPPAPSVRRANQARGGGRDRGATRAVGDQNQDRVGLLAFSSDVEKYVPPAKGQRHVLRLVRELLALKPAHRGTNIAMALDYANRILARRAVIFIISDFLDASAFETPLRVLARRHDSSPSR